MRRILVCSMLALLAGCGAHDSVATERFSVNVSPGIAGERNTIEIHDSDANAQTVVAEMNMPDMPMPRRFTLQRSSAGRYDAEGFEFSMSGNWIIVVHDGREHKATLRVR